MEFYLTALLRKYPRDEKFGLVDDMIPGQKPNKNLNI
jgi:hypothetical protein